eukprot:TRINITY_DN1974_c0_g1_i3.p1 TRINITY_DN1974_c0_g1~~TRINITY_DN1974_c0_g1_i3.p1  ORF type:complete len:546 (-),score=66.15 TRINITY_DN1974_c0_g1_i3:33-1670(-)
MTRVGSSSNMAGSRTGISRSRCACVTYLERSGNMAQLSDASSATQLIKNRWRMSRKIGAGAFGEIYAAQDTVTGEQVAIKLERCDSKKQVLKLEVAVLKKLQGCSHICRFIHCGRSNDYNYCVMELLGENLSDLRRKRQAQKFSVATSARLGSQMLRAIQNCHRRGFLHRDVKPSNYAIGLTTDRSRIVYIIDFGLARRYRLPSGEIRPPRDTAGFRGTARYASIHSHQAKELSRRDDLWSLFYVMVEFMVGQLPWRRLKDKDEILKLKMKHTTADLVRGLSPEMNLFLTYLNTLQYETDPDYDYIDGLFKDMLKRTGLDESAPYDWNVAGETPPTTPPPIDVSAQQRINEVVHQQRRASAAMLPRPPSETPSNRPYGRFSSAGVQVSRDDTVPYLTPGRGGGGDEAYLTPTASRDHSHASESYKGTGPRRASAISLNAGEVTTADIVDGDEVSQGGTPLPSFGSSRRSVPITPQHPYLVPPRANTQAGRTSPERLSPRASPRGPSPSRDDTLRVPSPRGASVAAPTQPVPGKNGSGCCETCSLM